MFKDCSHCTKLGKNLKTNISFNSSQPPPTLQGPHEEIQLDYSGLLKDQLGNQMYIVVAIDQYSKYASAMLTRSIGGWKIIIFL